MANVPAPLRAPRVGRGTASPRPQRPRAAGRLCRGFDPRRRRSSPAPEGRRLAPPRGGNDRHGETRAFPPQERPAPQSYDGQLRPRALPGDEAEGAATGNTCLTFVTLTLNPNPTSCSRARVSCHPTGFGRRILR